MKYNLECKHVPKNWLFKNSQLICRKCGKKIQIDNALIKRFDDMYWIINIVIGIIIMKYLTESLEIQFWLSILILVVALFFATKILSYLEQFSIVTIAIIFHKYKASDDTHINVVPVENEEKITLSDKKCSHVPTHWSFNVHKDGKFICKKCGNTIVIKPKFLTNYLYLTIAVELILFLLILRFFIDVLKINFILSALLSGFILMCTTKIVFGFLSMVIVFLAVIFKKYECYERNAMQNEVNK